jgi:hypothetical protein
MRLLRPRLRPDPGQRPPRILLGGFQKIKIPAKCVLRQHPNAPLRVRYLLNPAAGLNPVTIPVVAESSAGSVRRQSMGLLRYHVQEISKHSLFNSAVWSG